MPLARSGASSQQTWAPKTSVGWAEASLADPVGVGPSGSSSRPSGGVFVTLPAPSRPVAAESSAPDSETEVAPVDDLDDVESFGSELSSSRPVGACFVREFDSESDANADSEDVDPGSPIVKSSMVDSLPVSERLDTPVSKGWNPVVASVMMSGWAFWVVRLLDPGSENLGAPMSSLLGDGLGLVLLDLDVVDAVVVTIWGVVEASVDNSPSSLLDILSA